MSKKTIILSVSILGIIATYFLAQQVLGVEINMGSGQIKNLGAPTLDSDAANLSTVRSTAASDLSCTGCVTLGTETTGSYCATCNSGDTILSCTNVYGCSHDSISGAGTYDTCAEIDDCTFAQLLVSGTIASGGMTLSSTYGIRAQGSTMGGYFNDSDNSGYAYVGYSNYGIYGVGSSIGGYFKDSDGTSYAYLAYGSYGIYTGQDAYFGGKVGIGMAPIYKLDVSGDIRAAKIFDSNNTAFYVDPAGESRTNKISASPDGALAAGSWAVVGYGSYGVYGNGTDAYGVKGQGGYYGVYGYGGSYDFYAAGPGTNYGSASSIRWKTNITEIPDALQKVLNLRGVSFDWNKEDNTKHDIGFIAEEVGEIIPEIIEYDDATNESNWYLDKDGNKKLYATGVDYGALTPVLVEAIKELKDEKDKEITELRIENEEMKQSLCNLGAVKWCK